MSSSFILKYFSKALNKFLGQFENIWSVTHWGFLGSRFCLVD